MIVTRLVAALCALFGAAVLVFAWHASSAAPQNAFADSAKATNAEALFSARCASCHTTADAVSRVATARDSGSKALGELEFLDGHTPATPSENRAILEWLLARPRESR